MVSGAAGSADFLDGIVSNGAEYVMALWTGCDVEAASASIGQVAAKMELISK